MWGVFIGIGIGIIEVLILKKLIAMMTADKKNTIIAVPLVILKLAIILLVLFIMAKFVSLESMVWCAGGIAAMMIGIPVFSSIKTIRKYKKMQQGGEPK
ncbi:MAG: hypothetical protein RSA86_00125 [Christensenellaceae bacterium]